MSDRLHSNSLGNDGEIHFLLIGMLDNRPVLRRIAQTRVSTSMGKVSDLFLSKLTWREF